uniref:Uncharacterized protein n=1 Tax=Chromera velia CCMP2878 TaxID=1169474 RepID=A0A0G4HN94_9ALVE|eukprot:Cvel_7589.t1-p1 / transcript=Cvel_7589.t1 / gene=Cvel_7589 / organism=Chromera_velia_CCMP2878 / gene_product=hypothetical protein / transcript_product=hypothetical protein / location=Cvel_scaffold399:74155-88732(-) / protein_length=1083 / sequence_SO=supercontig / SO=protein_coding / is_pseudo=false
MDKGLELLSWLLPKRQTGHRGHMWAFVKGMLGSDDSNVVALNSATYKHGVRATACTFGALEETAATTVAGSPRVGMKWSLQDLEQILNIKAKVANATLRLDQLTRKFEEKEALAAQLRAFADPPAEDVQANFQAGHFNPLHPPFPQDAHQTSCPPHQEPYPTEWQVGPSPPHPFPCPPSQEWRMGPQDYTHPIEGASVPLPAFSGQHDGAWGLSGEAEREREALERPSPSFRPQFREKQTEDSSQWPRHPRPEVRFVPTSMAPVEGRPVWMSRFPSCKVASEKESDKDKDPQRVPGKGEEAGERRRWVTEEEDQAPHVAGGFSGGPMSVRESSSRSHPLPAVLEAEDATEAVVERAQGGGEGNAYECEDNEEVHDESVTFADLQREEEEQRRKEAAEASRVSFATFFALPPDDADQVEAARKQKEEAEVQKKKKKKKKEKNTDHLPKKEKKLKLPEDPLRDFFKGIETFLDNVVPDVIPPDEQEADKEKGKQPKDKKVQLDPSQGIPTSKQADNITQRSAAAATLYEEEQTEQGSRWDAQERDELEEQFVEEAEELEAAGGDQQGVLQKAEGGGKEKEGGDPFGAFLKSLADFGDAAQKDFTDMTERAGKAMEKEGLGAALGSVANDVGTHVAQNVEKIQQPGDERAQVLLQTEGYHQAAPLSSPRSFEDEFVEEMNSRAGVKEDADRERKHVDPFDEPVQHKKPKPRLEDPSSLQKTKSQQQQKKKKAKSEAAQERRASVVLSEESKKKKRVSRHSSRYDSPDPPHSPMPAAPPPTIASDSPSPPKELLYRIRNANKPTDYMALLKTLQQKYSTNASHASPPPSIKPAPPQGSAAHAPGLRAYLPAPRVQVRSWGGDPYLSLTPPGQTARSVSATSSRPRSPPLTTRRGEDGKIQSAKLKRQRFPDRNALSERVVRVAPPAAKSRSPSPASPAAERERESAFLTRKTPSARVEPFFAILTGRDGDGERRGGTKTRPFKSQTDSGENQNRPFVPPWHPPSSRRDSPHSRERQNRGSMTEGRNLYSHSSVTVNRGPLTVTPLRSFTAQADQRRADAFGEKGNPPAAMTVEDFAVRSPEEKTSEE